MKVEIRKTLTGTEYWDAEAKRILFVPKGEEPKFEVTTDPKSMIVGVDLATGKDLTVVNGHTGGDSNTPIVPDLNELTLDELITYAENSGVVVPGTMKKEETIRNYIIEKLSDIEKDNKQSDDDLE